MGELPVRENSPRFAAFFGSALLDRNLRRHVRRGRGIRHRASGFRRCGGALSGYPTSERFRAVAPSAIALRTGEMPPWAQERSGHTREDNENETQDAGFQEVRVAW